MILVMLIIGSRVAGWGIVVILVLGREVLRMAFGGTGVRGCAEFLGVVVGRLWTVVVGI